MSDTALNRLRNSGFRSKAALQPSASRTAVGYIIFTCAVGVGAGSLGLFALAGMAPPDVTQHARRVHAIAMLLYVALPALIGGFGKLLLDQELDTEGGELPRLLAGLDSASLWLVVGSFILFAAGDGRIPETWSILLWCIGIVLLAASTVARIVNRGARPEALNATAQERDGLSFLAWSQLSAAVGLLFSVPLVAAGQTRDLLASSPGSTTLTLFQLPAMAIILCAALGIAAHILNLKPQSGGRRAAWQEAVAISLLGAELPLYWAHGVIEHQSVLSLGMGLNTTAITFSTGFAVLCLRLLWTRALPLSGEDGVPRLWIAGFVALLMTGFVAAILHGDPVHQIILTGSVFVLFGAFYRWLSVTGVRYPVMLAQAQFGLLFAAVLLNILGDWPVLQGAGVAAMILSLAVLGVVMARLLLRPSTAQAAPALDVAS